MTEMSNREIIQELLGRVTELSERISPDVDSSVRSEVRTIFGRHTTALNLPNAETSRQRELTHHPYQMASTATIENRLPIRRNSTTAFQSRRYFPASRPAARSRTRRTRSSTAIDNRPFLRDLILLSGPKDNTVPRQGTRLMLVENGHMISGCRFSKDLSAAAVETNIMMAFDGKIPHGTDIELLTSVHSTLVAPTLAPGQTLDGVILHRLYAQKPVYVRPSVQLLNMGNATKEPGSNSSEGKIHRLGKSKGSFHICHKRGSSDCTLK
ncbi:uncharacterized protein LOC124451710 [Xenia sp. Carnegie-2017]|uniref:uncharacterized protein LOC124451710 n=2 Tax=Xenia sp. Carnegie-2017 TaxID=2897299 RepID=UPI001F04A82D|nr:uncharacterized protein LOC124451710 [Xenia sp. Carnegie-2017]